MSVYKTNSEGKIELHPSVTEYLHRATRKQEDAILKGYRHNPEHKEKGTLNYKSAKEIMKKRGHERSVSIAKSKALSKYK